jgi:stringent starvation protein B
MSDIPSTKPYLIRAIYEWCVDAGFTPYLAVVAGEGVRVPNAFVRDGQIVLNVAPHATNQFHLDNEAMSCQARFGGVAHMLYVPIANISAIYARENGHGMAFEVMGPGESAGGFDVANQQAPVEESADADESSQGDDDPSSSGGGRPKLRVVK